MLKIQPCVLRVSIHCEGCKHKVQKQLQKIEGVYKVTIDVDQGKVAVTGNVDPATLISKLEKSGKHAELWGGGPKGPITIMNNQFKNTQMEKGNFGKDGKGQKGGKGQPKGGGGFTAPKDMNFKNDFKDKKSVKFNLPEEEEGYSDEFDEFDPDDDDDSFVDDFDKGFAGHKPPTKAALVTAQGGKANKAAKDGHQKGKKGCNNGGNEKKGSRIDMFLKGMLGKAGVKTGTPGGNHSKKTDKAKGRDKNGGKGGGGGKNPSKGGKNGKPANKINENWSKNFDGYPKLDNRHPGFNEMRPNPGMMGQMPNFRAMPGLPAGAAMNPGYMNPGYFPGAGQGTNHPQNQQQYMDQMRMMMMMNQQQQHGNFNASGYNHPLGGGYMMQQQQHLQHPPMSYGPPLPPHPGNDQYTHMFSDENTGSCSIM